jgi:hypothetical protein
MYSPNLRFYPSISLEGLKETEKSKSGYLVSGLRFEPKYEAEVLIIQL